MSKLVRIESFNVTHELRTAPLSAKTLTMVLAAILPIAYMAIAIAVYAVNTPFWDEWSHIRWFVALAEHKFSAADLFTQENEYRQFFPNIVFVVLGWLSKGDFRFPMAVTFLLACFTSFNVYRLAAQTLGGAPSRWLPVYVAANVLMFSAIQYENWLQGQQLIYFVPIACLTSCVLLALSELRKSTKVVLCGALCTVSTFSSANGIVCWVLAVPLLLTPLSWRGLWEAKWWIAGWVFACALNLAVYLYGYQTPPHHPPLLSAFMQAREGAVYFFSILGRPLAPPRTKIAAAIGATLVVVYVCTAVYLWRHRAAASFNSRALPWLVVGGYSICTALLVTVGRAGFGVGQALTPRYTTFTLFLPVSLVFLVVLCIGAYGAGTGSRRASVFVRRSSAVLAALVVIYHVPIYVLSIPDMSNFHLRILTSKACVLLVNVIKDECEKLAAYAEYETVVRGANALDRLGFLEGAMARTGNMRELASAPASPSAHHGSFAALVPKGDGEYVASGEAFLDSPNTPAHLVVLAYATRDGQENAFAVTRLPDYRDIVSAALGWGNYADGGWIKSLRTQDLPRGAVRLSAWAFDAYTGRAYQLAGTHTVYNDAVPAEKGSR